jgi:hypothetical protein
LIKYARHFTFTRAAALTARGKTWQGQKKKAGANSAPRHAQPHYFAFTQRSRCA